MSAPKAYYSDQLSNYRRALLLLLLWLVLGPACSGVKAQSVTELPAVQQGATTYLQVEALARALGVVATADGDSLTWRGPGGTVTLFAGSPDALVPVGSSADGGAVALAAPVLSISGGWYAPLDALPLLGVEVPPFSGRLESLPLGGSALPLRYQAPAAVGAAADRGTFAGAAAGAELVEPPLSGVRFFDGEGVSLLLLDLALVPLAHPSLTREVDLVLESVGRTGSDRVLLLIVTALEERVWEASLAFEQEGRRIEVRPPNRLVIAKGSEGTVTPAEPVVGAVLLPPTYSPYRELRVEWAGGAADVLLRK